ncbi:Crp/Fnr family transcriptional regulator [Billgrantia kenyensis]|uniref:Crp/Fnr family transcriptional regulator n=1 Tax=Billgrantia kenyensis TaxID=321266 RepID=A0A7V9W498_9GAMM|nr:Crp/Fnr family transcriptional regulator [Halomonas kenyensis]MBA2780813.1 Crp/Fnr family transcriptional regulator [Halomonas kenyensis]MCG6661739.1 Crp/Fnr family transcriptional regulator [Halomonas kenyensis]
MSAAKTILERLAGDSLPDWHLVESALRRKTLAPGECLFLVGVAHPVVYFVKSGVIKMVYETYDGDAWVKAFAAEGRFFASLAGLSPGGVTSFSAVAACSTSVESLPYPLLDQLGDKHPQWQRALRKGFELYGFRKEARERDLLTLSAEQRYRRFIEEHPLIAERVTDRDIAGYVRVTPVALSRIKARIKLRQREENDAS